MKRIVVLGGGESGAGAAVLAKKKGFDVFLSDRGEIKKKYQNVLSQNGIEFESGKHTLELINNADEVVKSPGIPDTVPMIVNLREAGTPVISEIEFAARYTDGKLIGITGSNGKTTTATIVYHLLKKAGLDVGLAGNIGTSLASQLVDVDREFWVLELSSFQLDNMYETKLDIAIITSITADHLDRYDYKMQNYIDSKFRIVNNQGEEDHLIVFGDDDNIRTELEKRNIGSQIHLYTLTNEQKPEGAWVEGDYLKLNINGEFSMSIQELALQGKHNTANSMASALTGRILEIRKDVIRESLSDVEGVEHRMEPVVTISDVDYINDSKATNVNSTWFALESMSKPVVWIVGGVDKGNDYAELNDLVEAKVHSIIALGNDNSKIHGAFEGLVDEIVDATSMSEAVKLAYQLSRRGDIVLLSPACASFDLFENYEDRGDQFKEFVRGL